MMYGLVVGVNQKMAEPTGLEPATSRVTGERSNQLSYGSKVLVLRLPKAVAGSCLFEALTLISKNAFAFLTRFLTNSYLLKQVSLLRSSSRVTGERL